MIKKQNLSESCFEETPPSISEEEIISQLIQKVGPSLFLGRYSLNKVIAVFKKRNFIKEGEKKGLTPLIYELDSSNYPIQRFQVYFQQKDPKHLVVDLKIREGWMQPKKEFNFIYPYSKYNFLIIEWLALQNPLIDFSPQKPKLPGQIYPGLGLSKKVLDVFIYLARLIKKDGILIYPWYFHNALMYLDYFFFFNPYKQAEVLAIKESFPEIPFAQLSWIVQLECLFIKKKKIPYKWQAEEQIYPIKDELRIYFESDKYQEMVNKAKKRFKFGIDWECYSKKQRAEKKI
ncbi:MAG: hypothetical protein ACE5WD_06790 [Candidatus Aminicenantia bacterium]